MSDQDEHAIAAFIRLKGVNRCPTACAAPTQGMIAASDQTVLRQRGEQHEAASELARQQRLHRAWLRRIGKAAA